MTRLVDMTNRVNPCWYHSGDHPYAECPDAGIPWIEPMRQHIQQIVNPKDDSCRLN